MSRAKSSEPAIASPAVHLAELEDALGWISGVEAFGNRARVSRLTGEVHWSSEYGDAPDDLPDDIDDGSSYVAIPDKNDLDLGRSLVSRFVRERVPELDFTVHEIFARPGAHRRFKAWLERLGLLQAWFDFERQETAAALRLWAADQGLRVLD